MWKLTLHMVLNLILVLVAFNKRFFSFFSQKQSSMFGWELLAIVGAVPVDGMAGARDHCEMMLQGCWDYPIFLGQINEKWNWGTY